MATCPILTYHSQLIFGNDYHDNSHVALAEDLERIRAAGRRIVPLSTLVDALCAHDTRIDLSTVACITFDDGTDFDWHDLEHPQHGPQRSFANLLREHGARHGSWSGATSFVLASDEARRAIAHEALGRDWMRDDWWADAQRDGVLDIQSHGWDHRHPCLAADDKPLGHFFGVDDAASCALQVDRAADVIAAKLDGRRPDLFAYPYGQASDYLRREYLPRRAATHGFRAAVGTEPAPFHWDVDRWYLPRYIHVENWKSGAELDALLRDRN
jgi:peptidoglycan/xylan/chitin deacetylase (PgdA/CDA1 family)